MQFILAIAIAIFIYWLQSSYFRKHWKDDLQVHISFDKAYCRVGDTITLTEVVENHKFLPLPVLYVKFKTSRTFRYDNDENATISDYYYRNDVFSVLGNQQVIRNLSFRATKRGYFIIDSINLVVNDLFLKNTFADIYGNHAALYVYPVLLKDRYSLTMANSIIGDLTRKDLYEDPLSFRGIRDYASGDSMRHINWKTSAKQQQFMVNTYYDTLNADICILLNLDTNTIQRSNNLKEYLISVAATIANQMIIKGFSVQIYTNSIDSITQKPFHSHVGNGTEQLHHLLQMLSRIDLSKEITEFKSFFEGEDCIFHKNNTNTTYLVLSNYRREDLLTSITDKTASGYRIHFICPEYAALCQNQDNILFWNITSEEL